MGRTTHGHGPVLSRPSAEPRAWLFPSRERMAEVVNCSRHDWPFSESRRYAVESSANGSETSNEKQRTGVVSRGRIHVMPCWSIFCLYCRGYIADALLECVPASKRSAPAYRLLSRLRPGPPSRVRIATISSALMMPGRPRALGSGWPVFRYGRAELEIKRQADGEPADVSLANWALPASFHAAWHPTAPEWLHLCRRSCP